MESLPLALTALGASIAVLAGIGAGVSTGLSTGKAVEAVSRQPEATSKIISVLVIGNAFAEATAIYGLLVSILLIFIGVQ